MNIWPNFLSKTSPCIFNLPVNFFSCHAWKPLRQKPTILQPKFYNPKPSSKWIKVLFLHTGENVMCGIKKSICRLDAAWKLYCPNSCGSIRTRLKRRKEEEKALRGGGTWEQEGIAWTCKIPISQGMKRKTKTTPWCGWVHMAKLTS